MKFTKGQRVRILRIHSTDGLIKRESEFLRREGIISQIWKRVTESFADNSAACTIDFDNGESKTFHRVELKLLKEATHARE